jgi:hypothetical protein
MISLERVRTVAGIPAAFTGVNREKKELRLLKAKRDGKLKDLYDTAPWKPAKPRLRIESHIKCAYCESVAESQHGDVEHFRPKSAWWWLACCYDNFLLSCQICNQTYKGDKFPLRPTGKPRCEPKIRTTHNDAKLQSLLGTFAPDPLNVTPGRTLTSYRADCTKEKPLLIHPYQEKPEDFIIYEANAALHSVKVLPRRSEHKARIEACEECFGINRESLCEQRWQRYTILETAWKAWDQAPVPQKSMIEPILAQLVSPTESFTGMARYFVREVWKIPGI